VEEEEFHWSTAVIFYFGKPPRSFFSSSFAPLSFSSSFPLPLPLLNHYKQFREEEKKRKEKKRKTPRRLKKSHTCSLDDNDADDTIVPFSPLFCPFSLE